PAAERALRTRLEAAGVSLGERAAAASGREVLRRDGAVLALLLFLACGAVAVVVAAGAMLVAAFVGARQRAAESASLRLVGVPAATVRTGLLVENLAGVGVALVAGGAAAALAAWAVLPVLPLFDEPSAMIDPRTTPDVGAGLLSLLAVALGLGAVAVAVALTQGRSGTATIREGTR
ncbi:MAG TPA: FtsX-like permease family protein, partial [Actinomycetales bacterium]